jgi:cytoskeletal protein RodZ
MSLLRSERERLGKDLKEVAQVTRIKYSYLKAIEEADFKNLPARVYTRAYIRDYAKYLGVSPDSTIEDYERFLAERDNLLAPHKTATHEKDAVVLAKDAVSDNPHVPKTRNISAPLFKIFSILIVVSVVGLLLYGTQTREFGVTERVEYQPPQPTQVVPTNTTQDTSEGQSIYKTTEDAPQERPVKPFKHSLNIVATERVWLQVLIDGKEKKEMTLNPGETLTYAAQDSFSLIIGNAGGIKLRFDDKNLDNLGESGRVVKIRLPENPSDT